MTNMVQIAVSVLSNSPTTDIDKDDIGFDETMVSLVEAALQIYESMDVTEKENNFCLRRNVRPIFVEPLRPLTTFSLIFCLDKYLVLDLNEFPSIGDLAKSMYTVIESCLREHRDWSVSFSDSKGHSHDLLYDGLNLELVGRKQKGVKRDFVLFDAVRRRCKSAQSSHRKKRQG